MVSRKDIQLRKCRTAAQARKWVYANGINVSELARKTGISRLAFVDVMRGRGSAQRGDRHRAAVVLGMKPDPDAETKA